MKFKDFPLSIRLIIGFSVVLISILIVGINSISLFRQLSDISTQMYNHPLTVSNAVRDILININGMHRSMKDVVLAQTPEQLEISISNVNDLEKLGLGKFEIVFERFLGDPQDVQNAYQAFVDWKVIRDEVIQLLQAGEKEKAASITMGKGADHVDLLFHNAEKMVYFATEKAESFKNESDDLRKSIIKNLIYTSTIVLILSILIALFIIRSITVPIGKIIKKLKGISKEQFGCEILIEDSNQMAMLDSSVIELERVGKRLSLEISERKKVHSELENYKTQLEQLVKKRTEELEKTNKQLKKEIIEHKEAEMALKAIEERLRSFMDSATEGFTLMDAEFNVLDLNDLALNQMYLTKRADIVGKNIATIFPHFVKTERYAEYQKVIRTGEPYFTENVVPHPDYPDQTKHFSVNAFKVANGIGIISTDITERKKGEELLKQAFEITLSAEISANLGSWRWDLETKEVVWSDNLCRLHGIEPSDFDGRLETARKFIHPDDLEDVIKKSRAVQIKKIPESMEYRIIMHSGITKNVISTNRLILDEDGEIKQIVGVIQDITERKKIEDDLKISEEKYRSLIESTDDLIYLVDKNYSYIFMNKKHAERFNLPFNKIIGKPYSEFHSKKESEIFRKDVNKVIRTGNSITLEHKSDRDDKYYLRTFSPVKNEKGEVISVNVISKDISELKQVEKKLVLQSEIITNMSEGVYLIRSNDGVIVYTNPKFEKMFGYEPSEMIGKHVSMLNAPTDKSPDEIAKEIIEVINQKGLWKGEIKNIKKDGSMFWCYASVSPFDHPDHGKVWAVIHTDITKRKKAEEELENIFSLSPDMVAVCTTEGKFLKVNPTWENVLGYTQKELLDLGWVNLVHPNDVEKTNKEVKKQLKGNSIVNFVNRYKCKDGSYKIFEWQATFAKEGIVHATARDITERKKAEEELKHSQKELQKLTEHMQVATEQERGLIASELHDEVGQALTGLKMDIALIKNKMSKDKKEIPSEFQRMEKLLDDSIQRLRKIYSDLRPSLLEHFGIGEAMKQHVIDFQEQSGTKCTFYQDPEEIILDENRSIALYRIFQGAINNIKWHSQATKVDVRLEEIGPNLKLTIKDNGKGIEEEQIKSSDSFGLIGMRERARYLRGELKIKGIPDKGTTVMLEIPIKKIQ